MFGKRGPDRYSAVETKHQQRPLHDHFSEPVVVAEGRLQELSHECVQIVLSSIEREHSPQIRSHRRRRASYLDEALTIL